MCCTYWVKQISKNDTKLDLYAIKQHQLSICIDVPGQQKEFTSVSSTPQVHNPYKMKFSHFFYLITIQIIEISDSQVTCSLYI